VGRWAVPGAAIPRHSLSGVSLADLVFLGPDLVSADLRADRFVCLEAGRGAESCDGFHVGLRTPACRSWRSIIESLGSGFGRTVQAIRLSALCLWSPSHVPWSFL